MIGLLKGLTAKERAIRGQSLVEFALTLPIIAMLLMGIIDVGFVLYAHVQVAAASGEGANVGSRFVSDAEASSTEVNDRARQAAIYQAVKDNLTRLPLAAPNYYEPSNPLHPTTTIPQPSGSTDDILVTYSSPVSGNVTRIILNDPASTSPQYQWLEVRVKYRQQIIFLGFLPGVKTYPAFPGQGYFEVSSTTRARIQ